MSLPTQSDLLLGKFSLDGGPFCDVSINSAIDPNLMQFSLNGGPFWGLATGGSVAPVISYVPKIMFISIKA
jgi:hypothetical protein